MQDRKSRRFGQSLQEIFQAFGIDFPEWRKLKHDGPEFGTEKVYAFEVAMDCHLGILKLLHVGDEAAALGGEAELVRRGGAPLLRAGFEGSR